MIIILSSGKQCLVDDEDYSKIMAISELWSDDGFGYAIASYDSGLGYRTTVKMHRIVMGLVHNKDKHIHVDHISTDKADNRKCNLRLATPQQNGLNTNNMNPDRGVFYATARKRWQGSISVNGKINKTKRFKTRDEALWAVLELERTHPHKEFIKPRLPFQLPTNHPNYKAKE